MKKNVELKDGDYIYTPYDEGVYYVILIDNNLLERRILYEKQF